LQGHGQGLWLSEKIYFRTRLTTISKIYMDGKDGSSDTSSPNNGTTIVTAQPRHAASPINNAEPILGILKI